VLASNNLIVVVLLVYSVACGFIPKICSSGLFRYLRLEVIGGSKEKENGFLNKFSGPHKPLHFKIGGNLFWKIVLPAANDF